MTMSFGTAVAFIAWTLLWPRWLPAQQDTAAVELPDIVVSEGRVPLSATAVTSAVTVLSGQELRARGVTLVKDALREVPGLSVVEAGSFGAVTSLFARGGESDYVKVLVDGVPVNEPGGAYDFATLTLDDVDRIEIMRGPASVTYGSDAMTGVVRIVTRQGRGSPTGDLEVEAGNYGSVAGRAQASGATGALAWSVGGSRSLSDGTYDFNSDFSNAAGTARAVVRPDSRTDLAASVRYGWNEFHFPTDGAGIPADSNQFSRGHSLVLGMDGGRQLNRTLEVRLAGAFDHNDRSFEDASDGPGDTTGFAFASDRHGTSGRWSLDGRILFRPRQDALVSLGMQFERQLVKTAASYTSNFGGGPTTEPEVPFDHARNDAALYVEARAAPLAGLVVTSGARLDDDEAFGTYATWRAGARLALPAGFSLRGAAGTGFKAPTFAENFANSPFEVGNRALEPERSRSWEIGLEHEFARGVRSGVTWYDQRFRNLIQYVGAAPGEPTYENLGAALARGIEASVSVPLGRRASMGASWTWLQTRVTDAGASTSPGFANDRRLLRRPSHVLRWFGDASPASGVHLAAEVRYTGSRDDLDFGTFPAGRVTLPGYSVANLSCSADLMSARRGRPGLTVLARAENLFDTDYEAVTGFPGRSRTLKAGARLEW